MRKQLLIILILIPLMTYADAVEINGIYYNLVKKAKIAEITRHPKHYSGEIIIPEKISYEDTEYVVTAIGEDAFAGAEISTIIIPGNIETIGHWSFGKCYNLSSITLSEGLVSIGSEAFYDDYNLSSIVLPNSLKEIGENAFESCGLSSISFGSGLEIIQNRAFEQCYMLSTVNIYDIASWCHISFRDNPLRYAHTLYLNGEEIKDLVIPEGVDCINSCAFKDFTELLSVSFPGNPISIGSEAFMNCSNLTKIIIPGNIESVGYKAFQDCSKLEYIILGNGVGVVESLAFSNCPEISDVYSYSDIVIANADAFEGSYPSYITLHVPENAIDTYKELSPWNQFKEIVALKDDDPNTTDIKSGIQNGASMQNHYYSIDGKLRYRPQRGINIIRTNGGKMIKVFLK